MNRPSAALVGLVALGLAGASFVVLGFGRLLVGYRLAVLVAAPIGTLAFALAAGMAVLSVLGRAGVGPLAGTAGEE